MMEFMITYTHERNMIQQKTELIKKKKLLILELIFPNQLFFPMNV